MSRAYLNPPEPQGPPAFRGPVRMDDLQKDIDTTVDVMRSNLEKVLERDAQLSTLEDMSDNLKDGAGRFQKSTRSLKRKQWWANARWWIYTGLLVVVIVGVVVLVTVV
eukprot:m.457570 g.457570  ORF g.457570 m.457570 type:complete len:108 (+) comp21292_c0_seq1:371-694(+)